MLFNGPLELSDSRIVGETSNHLQSNKIFKLAQGFLRLSKRLKNTNFVTQFDALRLVEVVLFLVQNKLSSHEILITSQNKLYNHTFIMSGKKRSHYLIVEQRK